MLILKIDFKCILCGQGENFYTMPEDVKTKSNDRIHSLTKYKLVCKNCGKTYFLKFNIDAV